MRNRIVKVLLVVMILVGVKLLFFPTRSIKASPQETFGACVAQIPQYWGRICGRLGAIRSRFQRQARNAPVHYQFPLQWNDPCRCP